MGLLLILGGVISIALFVTFFALLFDGDAWYQVLIAAIIFAGIAAIGGVAEYKAGQNCIITTKEYKAFRIKRANVNISSEKPMLIRETHYHYPNYSVFYNDKSEYEILRIEE